jgi:L-methionine (R)-S-oxide reductase
MSRKSKISSYELLLKQATVLIEDESNILANMANLSSLIHQNREFLWTGFYFKDADELVLGPFQGPVACTRIQHGKGVCGTAWDSNETLIVPNVHEFAGHIACSEESKSEMVLPFFVNEQYQGVFDIDSSEYDYFDKTDPIFIRKILDLLN